MTKTTKKTLPRIIYVRALDCEKAPDNVRTVSDPAADAELEANIGETGGIIQNVIGLAIRGQKGRWHVYAGGRRLERVHANIANGTLDEDHMLPLFPARNKAEAIAMSMAENFHTLKMNPADECSGFQAVIKAQKKTPAGVAKQFGVTERFVLGRLRLANLAKVVFEALRNGEITLDVAKAYATYPDVDRQASVFKMLETSYHRHNVNEIQRHLAVGTYKGGDPKALLVGREAYLAANGRIDGDLYSDRMTEIWSDGDILDRLAEETLSAHAAALRDRDGFAEVRPVLATRVPYGETFQLRTIDPEQLPMSAEAEARHAEIDASLDELTRLGQQQSEGLSEEQLAQIDALEAERGALEQTETAYTEAQRMGAIAYVHIDQEGKPQLHTEFYAVETPVAVEPDDADADPDIEVDGDDDDEGIEQDNSPGGALNGEQYSARQRDELAMMKTELLAVHIANDPQFALDLGIFIMVDNACHAGWSGMPSELKAPAATPRVRDYSSETPAAEAWVTLDKALDRSWIDQPSLETRYDAFCAISPEARAAWLGWAIARTMTAVPWGGRGASFLDHLGAKLEIDVARWWRPTARNFFDGLTKPRILALFERVGNSILSGRYAKSRKYDLAVTAEKLFGGDLMIDPEIKERAVVWLPKPMRFTPEPVDTDSDAEIGVDTGIDTDTDVVSAEVIELNGAEPTEGVDQGAPAPGNDDDQDDLPEAA